MTFLNLVKELAFETQYAPYTFQLMEIYRMVLGHWRYFGDSEWDGESKKIFEFMQSPKFKKKTSKWIYYYRNSEEEFDSYVDKSVPKIEMINMLIDCKENLTTRTEKFVFNKYMNTFRASHCDLVEFKTHNSLDIIVVTSNGNAVTISSSLTSM